MKDIQNTLGLKKLKNAVKTDISALRKAQNDLERLIGVSPFLAADPLRKKVWLNGIHLLSLAEIGELKKAILTENIFFKQQKSTLRLEKLAAVQTDIFQAADLQYIAEPTVEDLDFTKTVEEEKGKLDQIFFVTIFALSDIFENKGLDAALRVKIDPAGLKIGTENRQRALNNVAQGLKRAGEWQDYFNREWPPFVDGTAEYFSLITEVKS